MNLYEFSQVMNIKIDDILQAGLIIDFHFIFFNWRYISNEPLLIPIHVN